MDTRKLILHIDGDSGTQSRIELEDFGTTHYIDGDTDMVAEMVKRHNAYPELLDALKDLIHAKDTGMGSSAVLPRFDIARDILSKYQPVTPA
jgi:hypothetical protein